ncbi:MAG: SPASM domain-containing protein [Syntrophobacteraceae bacterium]
MTGSFFRRLFHRTRRKRFAAWQIELTTRCPLRCRMCIRESCPDWHSADMDFSDFQKIAPYLAQVETAVLEGWGEPLLYRHLVNVVRLVKDSGCRAGFVTSGWGMNREYASDLMAAGLDFIGFSIAGATSGTHNAIRVNSDLATLSLAIREVVQLKLERHLDRPKLHLVYLMIRDNLREIPLLPQFAADLGIEEVSIINLIQVTDEWQESQRVYTRATAETESLLKDAEALARVLGIRLRSPSLSPLEIAVCDESPLQNLFISVDGEVAPCVYLHPPVPPSYRKIFQGRNDVTGKVSFGNIFHQDIESIWNDRRYIEFRNQFVLRKRALDDLFSSTTARAAYLRGKELPAPPAPCRSCHKILGF